MKPFPIGLVVGFLLGIGLTLSVLRLLNPPAPLSVANDWGVFPVPPRMQWLADGRKMRLLSDFYYIDPRSNAWTAPAGTEVDGASIPPFLWSVIGGPFEGQYRDASIVHDIECVRKTKPWEEVHYMFYEACRCGGVSETKAKLLYAGVYHRGPKWKIENRVRYSVTSADPNNPDAPPPEPQVETIVTSLPTEPPLDRETLRKLQEYIETNNPDIESLQSLDVTIL